MAEDTVPNLRSVNSNHKSFVRFYNNTLRKVDVIWINFEGHHVRYKTLSPGSFLDVNTFATHPWLFIDAETQDKLVVKSKEVFHPEPFVRRDQVSRGVERTYIYITIPMYTLRQRSLQVLRNKLSQPEDAYKLDLPSTLQLELSTMLRESMKT